MFYPVVSGLFEWLRRSETPAPPAAPPAATVIPALLHKDAQFEMATADEKFLNEAKHMEISPLDSCHYRVIVNTESLRIHLIILIIYQAKDKNYQLQWFKTLISYMKLKIPKD